VSEKGFEYNHALGMSVARYRNCGCGPSSPRRQEIDLQALLPLALKSSNCLCPDHELTFSTKNRESKSVYRTPNATNKSIVHFLTNKNKATHTHTRPCSPIWDKWNGSSGQTPCPCPTCPTNIWRPPSPRPTCPTKIWRPPSPCPTCPTYSNLSQLVPFGCTTCPFPTLFSEIFVWVSHCHSIFRKTFLNEKFVSKYYHVGEGISNK